MKDIYICLTNEKKNSDNYIVKEILKEAIGYSYGLNFFKKELSKIEKIDFIIRYINKKADNYKCKNIQQNMAAKNNDCLDLEENLLKVSKKILALGK